MKILGTLKAQVLTILMLLVLSAVAGVAAADKSKSADQEKKYARPTDPSLYVGAETCKTCHEDMPSKGFYKSYEDSPHYVTTLDTKKGPEWHGCEACHGPGKAHVEGGGDKSKIFSFKTASAKQVNERCLTCHASGKDHANFSRSAHSENNLSCLTCLSSHHSTTDHFLLVKAQPDLCYSCHLNKKAQFNMQIGRAHV